MYPQSLWRNDARTFGAVTFIFNRHQALADQIQQHKHFTGNTYTTHCISSILYYKLVLSNICFPAFFLRPRLEFLILSNIMKTLAYTFEVQHHHIFLPHFVILSDDNIWLKTSSIYIEDLMGNVLNEAGTSISQLNEN